MYNPIDAKLQELSVSSGIDEATLKLAICLFISFPFDAILKRLPDHKTTLKCCYIVSVSAFYLFGILNIYDGFRTLFISTMFTYLITRFYKSKFMPYLNFVFVMGHLATNHIYSQFFNTYDSRKIDITGAQMVLVMKLTSFAWSYHDGSYCKDEELSEYQKTKAIKSHPTLLQFVAYAFFYPSLLTGPSFDYADFESWLNVEIFRDLPESRKPRRRWATKDPHVRRQIPKCGRLALWRVIQGILWIVLSSVAPKYVSLDFVFSSGFKTKSFLYRIHYLALLGFTFRLKYYAAWTISEASCMVCGLGYNGFDAKTQTIKWNRVQNIDIKAFEMAQNTHESLEAWNMNTNKWLKHYVYLRVVKKGSKPGFRSTLFTFLTSAFWHGTRPGYYLSFATGALFQTCGKFFRRNFRPIFLAEDGKTALPSKKLYDFVCFYVTKLAFGYLVQPFVILDWKSSIHCWSTVFFYVHLGIILSFFAFRGPFSKQFVSLLRSLQPKEIAIRKQKKEEKTIAETSGSLGDILKAKHEFEREELENDMQLGIPSADFNEGQLAEAKKDFQEFSKEYEQWRAEKGLEVEEENLRKAYENFRRELQSTVPRRMSFSDYSPKPVCKE